ncbi:MAG: LapA family protein [Rivularia sp. ALOHA_DT_140]|nr:LapA family protein [Rivularia sp. ALOHA_DT_140]
MLLLAQNWSPAIPLVFLGLQTKPISIAIWMLLSTAAGAFTSLLISSLVQLSSRSTKQQRQRTSYEPFDSPKVNQRNQERESEFRQRKTTPRQASPPKPRDEFDDSYDDWDLDRNANDDWDLEEQKYFEQEEKQYSNNPRSSYTKIQDDRDYENFQEEEDDYDPAENSYSYDKSDLEGSGTGKTDSVYDADYRVIVPPANSSTTPETSDNSDDRDDDDWGFLEEDFDSDKKSPRQ